MILMMIIIQIVECVLICVFLSSFLLLGQIIYCCYFRYYRP